MLHLTGHFLPERNVLIPLRALGVDSPPCPHRRLEWEEERGQLSCVLVRPDPAVSAWEVGLVRRLLDSGKAEPSAFSGGGALHFGSHPNPLLTPSRI